MHIRKVWQNILRIIGLYILSIAATVLCTTLKIKILHFNGEINLLETKNFSETFGNKNFIVAFWHGTMFLPWYVFRNRKIVALISQSKDGELLARVLKHWNYKVIRGSSSKGGDEALNTMIEFAKNGYSVAITPDGPKGPPLKMKAGAIITAKKSNLPLILVGVYYKKKRILKSWDSFQIPYPFSEVNLVLSKPIYIDSDLTYDETSKKIIEYENYLNELQSKAREIEFAI